MMRAEGRILIWQLASAWLVMYGCQVLSTLSNVRFSVLLDQGVSWDSLSANNITGRDISSFVMWFQVSKLLGLVLVTLFSLWFSRRRKYHWLVPLLLFASMLILGRLDLLGWGYLRHIFSLPGRLFEDVIMSRLTNGLLLVALGTSAMLLSLPDRREFHNATTQPSQA